VRLGINKKLGMMFSSALNFVRVETAAGVHRGLGKGIGSRFDRQRTQQASDKNSQENDKETQPAVSGKNHLSLAYSSHMKKTPHNPMMKKTLGVAIAAALTLTQASALVVPFMEDFESNNSNWLNGASASATWLSSGGVDGGAYISYTAPTFKSAESGPFPGSPPLQVMLRANSAANASGGAFVGDWLSGEVSSLDLAVRHNFDSSLNFYARLASTGGAGASLAFDEMFAIAPNTWTLVSIPVVDSNPPFLSYGTGSFNGIFSNIQNLQFGLYVPASTDFIGLSMDIDNVSVVPETSTVALLVLGIAGLALLRRRNRSFSPQK
jgi:hypothetical protein